MSRKYKFDWGTVTGGLETARPLLGATTRVEIYRLFQFAVRDILEQRYGAEMADTVFRDAGQLAGNEFFAQFCKCASDVNSLVRIIQDTFKELGVGIFRVEKADIEALEFTMTVDEDLDCSGMPDTDDQICVYDEGFIAGILEAFTGKPFVVREVDCWCSGSRTCRFAAKVSG